MTEETRNEVFRSFVGLVGGCWNARSMAVDFFKYIREQGTHRTCQNTLVAVMVEFMLEYAKNHTCDFDYDRRNESAVLFCKWLAEQKEQNPDHFYFPLI